MDRNQSIQDLQDLKKDQEEQEEEEKVQELQEVKEQKKGEEEAGEDDPPVDYDEKIKEYGFTEEGPKHMDMVREHPHQAYQANKIKTEVEELTNDKYKASPSNQPWNNEADAFRHSLWCLKVTRKFGPETCRELGFAHERQKPNTKGERLMDLHNHDMVIQLARNPASKRYKDEQVIDYAIRGGYLRTKPFKIKGEQPTSPGFEERRPGLTAFGRIFRDR